MNMEIADYNHVVIGLLSSHPYAVKAIESATGNSINVNILAFITNVPYIKDVIIRNNGKSLVADTKFMVDHTEVNKIITNMKDWKLGDIQDGEEFVAIIFNHNLNFIR